MLKALDRKKDESTELKSHGSEKPIYKVKRKRTFANKYTSQIAANDELLVISSGDKCSGKISSNYIRWCSCATSPSLGISNKFLFF